MPAGKKIILIVFSGGMYVGENSSHGASVELFACGEQPRHRAQCSPFCQRCLLLWQAYLTFYDMHYIIKNSARLSKKPRRVFCPQAKNSFDRFFRRHVRRKKHFSRSECRIVRLRRTTEAQSAVQLFCRRTSLRFFDKLSNYSIVGK